VKSGGTGRCADVSGWRGAFPGTLMDCVHPYVAGTAALVDTRSAVAGIWDFAAVDTVAPLTDAPTVAGPLSVSCRLSTVAGRSTSFRVYRYRKGFRDPDVYLLPVLPFEPNLLARVQKCPDLLQAHLAVDPDYAVPFGAAYATLQEHSISNPFQNRQPNNRS
jgi:hypothetical protein